MHDEISFPWLRVAEVFRDGAVPRAVPDRLIVAAHGMGANGTTRTRCSLHRTLLALPSRYRCAYVEADILDPLSGLFECPSYSKGPDGEFYPNEYAPLVVEMYEMAADGYTAAQITNYLNAEGITNHNGCAFHRASVTRMLRNPAYKGDFIAQRYYVTEDRMLVKNEGEKPMLYIEEDHIPIVTVELWDKAQATLDGATHKKGPTESKAMELTDENYPYRKLLFCGCCGHRLNRAVRVGRVLWECNGKTRFSQEFCDGVQMTDDEVREWLPIEEPIYIEDVVERGVVKSHTFKTETEWKQTHSKKKHLTAVPDLTEENFPYKDRIFCKYCGSRLRRIINKNGTITWICDGLSRKGKSFCKGIRVPDEKLKPLANMSGNFYIGKEKINGTESYGYSRKKPV